MQTHQRITWIDVVKGLCIVLVVQHHFVTMVLPVPMVEGTNGVANAAFQFWVLGDKIIGPMRMPVFFFLSGYLIQRSVSSPAGLEKRRGRVDNYLWLYVVFGAIQWLAVTMLNVSGPEDTRLPIAIDAIYANSIGEYLANMALGNASLWYLYALALYYLICSLLDSYRIAAVIFATIVYVVTYLLLSDLEWGPLSLIHNFPYYMIGAYWGRRLVNALQSTGWRVLLPTLVLLAFATIMMTMAGYAYRFVGSVFAIVAVIGFVSRIKRRLEGKLYRWLDYLGQNTLTIYIFHRIGIEMMSATSYQLVGTQGFTHPGLELLWTLVSPVAATLGLCVISSSFGNFLRPRVPWVFVAPGRRR